MVDFIKTIKEFVTYDLLRTLFIEFYKSCLTILFAYISFRVFQNYKEKQLNNKVYIKFLKLRDNINKNSEKIQEILDLYEEGLSLQNDLMIKDSDETYYYDIIKKINDIIDYYLIDDSYCDFYNELIESNHFDRYPKEVIRDLSIEIEDLKTNLNNEKEIIIKENDLNHVKKMDIFRDLDELYEIMIKADKENKLSNIISKLKEFNESIINFKIQNLDTVCRRLFLENEIVISLNEKYKEYNNLTKRLLENQKKEEVKIVFKDMEDREDELASYDAEFYFKIENFIDKYDNKRILLNDKILLEKTHKEIRDFKNQLDIKIDDIKKKIDSTKKFFGY